MIPDPLNDTVWEIVMQWTLVRYTVAAFSLPLLVLVSASGCDGEGGGSEGSAASGGCSHAYVTTDRPSFDEVAQKASCTVTVHTFQDVEPTGGSVSLFDASGNILAWRREGETAPRYVGCYDSAGRLTAQTDDGADPAGEARIYDAQGRLIRVESINFKGNVNHIRTYEYDAAGQLVKASKSEGGQVYEEVEFTYDDAGRLTAEKTEWEETTYTYDASGRLTTATSGGSTTEFTYSDGQIVVDRGSDSGGVWATGTHVLDEGGRLIRWEKVADGELTRRYEWTYDADGRLTEASKERLGNDGETWLLEKERRSYNAAGLLEDVDVLPPHQRDNEMADWRPESSYVYDSAGRLAEKYTPAQRTTYEYSGQCGVDLAMRVATRSEGAVFPTPQPVRPSDLHPEPADAP